MLLSESLPVVLQVTPVGSSECKSGVRHLVSVCIICASENQHKPSFDGRIACPLLLGMSLTEKTGFHSEQQYWQGVMGTLYTCQSSWPRAARYWVCIGSRGEAVQVGVM